MGDYGVCGGGELGDECKVPLLCVEFRKMEKTACAYFLSLFFMDI